MPPACRCQAVKSGVVWNPNFEPKKTARSGFQDRSAIAAASCLVRVRDRQTSEEICGLFGPFRPQRITALRLADRTWSTTSRPVPCPLRPERETRAQLEIKSPGSQPPFSGTVNGMPLELPKLTGSRGDFSLLGTWDCPSGELRPMMFRCRLLGFVSLQLIARDLMPRS
jgi:hypothetical protein